MNNLYFNGKHVFFISDCDKFFYLYADALIHKVGVNAEDILAVVYSLGETCQFESLKQVPNISYSKYVPDMAEFYSGAKTITFMSLHKWNSGIVREIIEYDLAIVKKIYIFLTDDEFERWYVTYLKYGSLVVNEAKHISDNDIYVLSKIINFIGDKGFFEKKIQLMLNRKTVTCVDAGIIFDILPSKTSEDLYKITKCIENGTALENKILIGSKPRAFSIKDIIKIIKSCCESELHNRFSFLLFWPEKNGSRRVILDLYLIYLRYIKRRKVNISYIGSLSPLAYNVFIMSCSHFILQGRGGVSTARLYMKWGQGSIYVANKTINNDYFKNKMKFDIISFDSYLQVAESIKNESVDIEFNAKIAVEEEIRSITVLAGIYYQNK